ncbi:MAG: polysaccharide deacetylase family protein [Desulfobulbaceae bacterium]|nr:polysaccharide deacetylase family protein [Desulfobulbaceae bacterium]
MNGDTAAIWSGNPPSGMQEKIREILDSGNRAGSRLNVFFRADDIARCDERFRRLMLLFQSHRMPLCLAVVPGWLNTRRWQDMERFNPESTLWCWHQHGWNHINHEMHGKKSEFGAARDRESIRRDLATGKKHLTLLLGDLFFPVFTPPWNRCSSVTLELIEELGFSAVSRSLNAKPQYKGKLPDLAVNVDLHTRKETDPRQAWNNLLLEFTEAAQSGCIGLMLHHLRMNDAAFDFLSFLLPLLQSHPGVACRTFRGLL